MCSGNVGASFQFAWSAPFFHPLAGVLHRQQQVSAATDTCTPVPKASLLALPTQFGSFVAHVGLLHQRLVKRVQLGIAPRFSHDGAAETTAAGCASLSDMQQPTFLELLCTKTKYSCLSIDELLYCSEEPPLLALVALLTLRLLTLREPVLSRISHDAVPNASNQNCRLSSSRLQAKSSGQILTKHESKLGTAVCDGPLENVRMTPLLGPIADTRAPWAPVGTQPLQHLQMSVLRGARTRPSIPWTAVLSGPLQHFEMTVQCGARTNTRIPRTTVFPRPLQHVRMTLFSSGSARFCIPGAAFCSRPLQHLQVSAHSRVSARPLIPRTSSCARPLQQPQVATQGTLTGKGSVQLHDSPANVRLLHQRPVEGVQLGIDELAHVAVQPLRRQVQPRRRRGAIL